MTRKLNDMERAGVEKLFGDLGCEQGRLQLMSRDELRDARHTNNVNRPSYVGHLIDDLTTLAAVLLAERDKLQEELDDLNTKVETVLEVRKIPDAASLREAEAAVAAARKEHAGT
jgi:hypothetical protein